MAKRRRRGGESVAAYFRAKISDQPNLLDDKGSNAILLEMYKNDHPNQTAKAMKKVAGALANTKSIIRKELRGEKTTRSKPVIVVGTAVSSPNLLDSLEELTLPALEEQIDDCLSMAKRMDRAGLEEVIHHLRLARNKVVWKITD
jgi:hypothetical protein